MSATITFAKIAAAALALAVTAAPAFGHDPGPSRPDLGQYGPGMTAPHMKGPGMMPHGQGWMGHGGRHYGPGMPYRHGWMGHGGRHYGPGMPYRHGWMGHGGRHYGPGMPHRHGWMGHGGRHHGPGWTGPGMHGYGYGRGALRRDLAADDVKHILEHRLQWQGFTNLRVGDVVEADDDTLIADVVTQEGTLVQQFEVNRQTGAFSPVE